MSNETVKEQKVLAFDCACPHIEKVVNNNIDAGWWVVQVVSGTRVVFVLERNKA
jgi:hypothetical protein